MGEFLVEGFKLHHHAGYEMTVVKYQTEQIEAAAAEFHTTFGRSGDSRVAAIQRVRQMYENVSKLSVPRDSWQAN